MYGRPLGLHGTGGLLHRMGGTRCSSPVALVEVSPRTTLQSPFEWKTMARNLVVLSGAAASPSHLPVRAMGGLGPHVSPRFPDRSTRCSASQTNTTFPTVATPLMASTSGPPSGCTMLHVRSSGSVLIARPQFVPANARPPANAAPRIWGLAHPGRSTWAHPPPPVREA